MGHTVQGLTRCLVDEDLSPEELHLHGAVLKPGARAHPPHTHDGVEAVCVLDGEGTLSGHRAAPQP